MMYTDCNLIYLADGICSYKTKTLYEEADRCYSCIRMHITSPEKQLSFQDNWVNTQAFSIGYPFVWYSGIISNWYFLKIDDYW